MHPKIQMNIGFNGKKHSFAVRWEFKDNVWWKEALSQTYGLLKNQCLPQQQVQLMLLQKQKPKARWQVVCRLTHSHGNHGLWCHHYLGCKEGMFWIHLRMSQWTRTPTQLFSICFDCWEVEDDHSPNTKAKRCWRLLAICFQCSSDWDHIRKKK